MTSLLIQGATALQGEVAISGAKNAALPLLTTSLMCSGRLQLNQMPHLADTQKMVELLKTHGLTIDWQDEVIIIEGEASELAAPYELVRQMRASILVLGPLLARYGEARVSLPGGCAIGTRPVDLHIRAMQKLGAVVELADGYIQARARNGLFGAQIVFPFVSVGATENALMAACLAKGESVLVNAAREPEITDLAECLIAMGAKIEGHGTDRIYVQGVDELHTTTHDVVPDRIEAGSFAIGAAMTRGDLMLRQVRPDHLTSLFDVLQQTGVSVEQGPDWVRVKMDERAEAVDIETHPYPGFPTDLQAQYMAMMCLAKGSARISETIFENRFMHVPELMRMGADIQIDGRTAIVHGKEMLRPAPVMATDLRASISLVLAGMTAAGETEVSEIYHLDRGYTNLEDKLGKCGAKLSRKQG